MYSGTFDYDVIIVGAGISGLVAAYAIHQRDNNLSFLVLEGNDRLGGRAFSVPLFLDKEVKPVDIGGQFISPTQSHMRQLLEKLHLNIVENNNNDGYTIGDICDGIIYKTDVIPPIFGESGQAKDIMQFLGTLETLSDRVSLENPMNVERYNELDSTTMEAFIHNNLTYSMSKHFMRLFIKTTLGAEPADVSVLFFLTYCHSTEGVTNSYLRTVAGGKGCWIKEGAQQICYRIAEEIGEDNIKTSNPVTAITRTDFGILVHTAEHEYKCRYCIIAMPPNQILNVNFYPPLSNGKNTILKRMRYRSRIKFVVTYASQFWQKENYNGDIFCSNNHADIFPIMVTYNVSSEGKAVLTGLLDADYNNMKNYYKKEVLTQLSNYFGSQALEPLDYVEKCWSDEEHIFEGYAISFPPPKMMSIFHEIRRPIGRLFFAGSETATYWYGHMSGAVQAGFRAALEVLYEIRPQALSAQDFIDLRPPRKLVQFYTAEEESAVRQDWIVVMFISSLISYLLLKTFNIIHYLLRLCTRRQI